MRARFRVNGASVCLQPLRGDLVTVWGRWAGRDGGERTQQETLAERAGASWRGRSVVRWVAQGPALPSGRKWNRSQSGQGAAELGFPGPALWQMQSEAARRAGEPSGEREKPPSEGLGGHDLLAQTDSRRPAGQRAITCTASQEPLAAKRPEGRWLRPTPYLRSRMVFSISAWRR